MSLAEVIYQKSLDLPADEAQEVIKFIELIKTCHTLKKPANTILEPPIDYEQAQQQASAFLDAPPLLLNGRYGSRDSLYDRL